MRAEKGCKAGHKAQTPSKDGRGGGGERSWFHGNMRVERESKESTYRTNTYLYISIANVT